MYVFVAATRSDPTSITSAIQESFPWLQYRGVWGFLALLAGPPTLLSFSCEGGLWIPKTEYGGRLNGVTLGIQASPYPATLCSPPKTRSIDVPQTKMGAAAKAPASEAEGRESRQESTRRTGQEVET